MTFFSHADLFFYYYHSAHRGKTLGSIAGNEDFQIVPLRDNENRSRADGLEGYNSADARIQRGRKGRDGVMK
jgi:hypothetical protein